MLLNVSDIRFIDEFLNISDNVTKLGQILSYVFLFYQNIRNSN